MSDIFISYSSEDKGRVQALAQALERKGWSVWWDRRIPVGRSYAEVIEEALDASKAVVVVWTTASVKSQWVKNEALEGLNRRVLFPVMLEAVKIPLEFRHVQAARLLDWQPEQDHAAFDQFIDDLAGAIGAPVIPGVRLSPEKQSQVPTPSPTSQAAKAESLTDRAAEDQSSESARPVQSKQSPPYLIIGAGLLVVVGAFAGQWFLSPIPSPRPVNPPPFQTPVQTPPTQSQVATPHPVPVPAEKPLVATPQAKPATTQATTAIKTTDTKLRQDSPLFQDRRAVNPGYGYQVATSSRLSEEY